VTLLARLAHRSGLSSFLRAFKNSAEGDVPALQRDVRALARQVEQLQATLQTMSESIGEVERTATQTRLILRLNNGQRDHLEKLPKVLDAEGVSRAIHDAVARTPLHDDPYPHAVVEGLLPERIYRAVLRGIPPPAFFSARDPIKQNLRIPIDFGPAYAEQLWQFVHDVVATDAIRNAVIEKFREPLRRHYAELFGPEFVARAEQLPQAISGGRLMLRRPGYFLAPHRDPKRSMLTCLLYLAKPGDSEAYGTGLYRVKGDTESSFMETFYPGEHGLATELAKTVPNRPNSMLVFLNGRGAHGAGIPESAPADLERYAFQFYIGPEASALDALVAELPPVRQAMWTRKKQRD
jgi:hypothetical protein